MQRFRFAAFSETVSFIDSIKYSRQLDTCSSLYANIAVKFLYFCLQDKKIDDSDFWKIDVRVREGYLNVSNTVSMLDWTFVGRII